MSLPTYKSKGKGIWMGQYCSVWCNDLGGLTYQYRATRTSGRPWCAFTLFGEVGEPYQHLFEPFFNQADVDGYVEYENWPYLADRLKNHERILDETKQ